MPLKHSAARAFHAASPPPLRPTTTVQPCCWDSSHVGAVAAEDLVAGAAGRADEALAAVELAQHGLAVLRRRRVEVGRSAAWCAWRRARWSPSRRGPSIRSSPWSAWSWRRRRRRGVVGGRAVVGVDGVCIRWYVSRAVTERPNPAGATLEVVAAGAVVVVVGRRRSSRSRRRRVVVVAPATVVVVAPGVVVVVVAFGSGAAVQPRTGRKVTMPATSTASRAWRWSFTPGRSTTMLEPSTRTSGSAMPRFSSSLRIRSRMTMRSPLLAPASGASTTDTPPCRSSPSAGVLRKPRLSARRATVMPTQPSSDAHRRRRVIPRSWTRPWCRPWSRRHQRCRPCDP